MADDPGALNSAGLRALGAGDPATAAALLRRAVAADSGAALLWYNLATALNATGERAAEASALEKALDLEPYLPHALLALGRWHEIGGDIAGALDLYRRLIAATTPGGQYGPGFLAGFNHAREALAAATTALSAQLETALSPTLAKLAPADRLRFEHCVDIGFGRRRVFQPEPLVLHYPYLPPEQFLARQHFPWFAELEAATPIIRAELESLLAAGDAGFAPYVAYPPGTPVNQWAALNHSDSWAAQFLIQHGVPHDAMRARCPGTAAVLDKLPLFDCPGRGPVAFFSLLKPHTRIPPHTGATNIRTIVHLPLIVPGNCGFRVGNETRQWVEGEAFAFDDSIEHEAWNDSDQRRAVLIVDTWNPHLTLTERDLLRQYTAVLQSARPGQSFDPR
jgi:aspartate beta-hydroxylase